MVARTLLAALTCCSLLFAGATADARVIRSGMDQGYVDAGVFELGFDNVLLWRSHKATNADDAEVWNSTSGLLWTGGLTPRFFVMRNLAVSAQINYFLEGQTVTSKAGADAEEVKSESSDGGLLLMGMVHYYLHLAGGMFFKPGLGGGYAMLTRSVPDPTDDNKKVETKRGGVVGKLDLGLAYYASEHLVVRAGPEFLLRMGQEKFDDATGAEQDGDKFTMIDATFGVGLGWVF